MKIFKSNVTKKGKNIKDTDLTVNNKNEDIELPDVTIEKLIKNECVVDSTNINNEEVEELEEIIDITDLGDVEYNDVNYQGRGFKTLEDAINFMNTPYFNGLGECEKIEYRNWLIKR